MILSNLFSMGQQEIGISRVVSLEGNRSGGQSGGGFTGKVRTRMGLVDLESGSRSGHILGTFPTEVIGGAIADLTPKNVALSVGFEKVIGGPFNGLQSVVHLVGICNFLVEINGSP